MMSENLEKATFANGCFWCSEAVFQRFKGIYNVKSGYTGGFIKNPPYREVCQGRTGHAEGIQFDYDPSVISYQELLQVFFTTHDPTTLNRQGNDVGTQYRSAIFYHTEEQKQKAENFIKYLDSEQVFDSKIVTEVTEAKPFYLAEEEHDSYYNKNKMQGYCQFIINPKVNKIKQLYRNKLQEVYL
ncbi:peptide-methionine (S)-S-oxide reductase MsrA [Leeuwenhoekiella marinoflava]|uniref:Peptide methionine sulfoxide reductase MsrA n=3 Tax=Leeuwenhoekiella marinoflava TaxID=988 RepID=A0A4Q0PQ27_9FLAO|nr:peptide-methionine (S)-S-oxide reductase [Leeuwenhoekiella marinoflava]SHE53891.1 peptide-methionine (S)-S-oxide reductase [Leeuwenhoekiella marinoflava DSM 3653]